MLPTFFSNFHEETGVQLLCPQSLLWQSADEDRSPVFFDLALQSIADVDKIAERHLT